MGKFCSLPDTHRNARALAECYGLSSRGTRPMTPEGRVFAIVLALAMAGAARAAGLVPTVTLFQAGRERSGRRRA